MNFKDPINFLKVTKFLKDWVKIDKKVAEVNEPELRGKDCFVKIYNFCGYKDFERTI